MRCKAGVLGSATLGIAIVMTGVVPSALANDAPDHVSVDGGPILTRTGLAWTEQRGPQLFLRVNGRRRPVGEPLEAASDDRVALQETTDLAGDASRIALVRRRAERPRPSCSGPSCQPQPTLPATTTGVELWLARAGGEPERVTGLEREELCGGRPGPQEVEVGEAIVLLEDAIVDAPCFGRERPGSRIVVLGDDGVRRRVITRASPRVWVRELRSAGRWVAWRQMQQIFVADVRTGRVAYRLRAPGHSEEDAFDVDEAGRVALIEPGRPCQAPGRFEPTYKLLLATRERRRFRLIGTAMAPAIGFASGRLVVQLQLPGCGSGLAALDVRRGARRRLQGCLSSNVNRVDFDGRRIALVTRRNACTRFPGPPLGVFARRV